MKLTVATPLAVIVEADNVAHVRAEDDTGAFGILPRHADFLTALRASVVTWRDAQGAENHVAVRGGVFEIRGGNTVLVATPEAVAGDDLQQLETDVIAGFRRQFSEEQAARSDAQRLYLASIRQIIRFLRPQKAGSIPSTSPEAEIRGFQP
jgi:F-type H+-transporting ATPase subunit epsilon